MGRVIVLPKVDGSEGVREYDFEGPFIDFLDKHFADGPKGMTHCTVDGDGNRVEVDDYLNPVGDQTYTIAFAPAGLEAGTIAIIVAAVSVAISVAAILLQPKAPGAPKGEDAGSVYSVSAQANRAKIGGLIPYPVGRVTRTPEYASQSYRRFVNNEEIRYFLLCVGVGTHRIDALRVGDTPVTDLPAGLVEYKGYTPSEHRKTLGVIDADFDIHENVYTSGDVAGQEMDTRMRFQGRAIGASSGARLTLQDVTISSRAQAGDKLVLGPPFNVERFVESVSGKVITLTEALTTRSTRKFDLAIVANSSGVRIGPYPTNLKNTVANKVEIDIVFPGGLHTRDDEGNLQSFSATFLARFQRIDDDGNNVGGEIRRTKVYEAETVTPIRDTWVIDDLPDARFKVSLERQDFQNINRQVDRAEWSGLKAYLDYEPGAKAYDETTIVAVKITSARELSASSQQRIFVTSTSLLNKYGTNEKVYGGNLVDVVADIYTGKAVGARRPLSELDGAALLPFRDKVKNLSGFNGVFDSPTTVWDALEAVLALGRAKPYPKSQSLSLVIDEPKPRSSIVTPQNVLRGTPKAQYNWLLAGTKDSVEVVYRDPDTFDERYSRFPVDGIDPESRELLGMTNKAEADEYAEYLWSQKTARNLDVTFSTELDAMNHKPFDRVGVALPAFNWGEAAEILSVNGLALTLSNNAPDGPLTILLRDQKGQAGDTQAATGDGSKVIVLSEEPSLEIATDGRSVRTLCAFGLTEDFIQDVTILSVEPSGRKSSVKSVNYVEI